MNTNKLRFGESLVEDATQLTMRFFNIICYFF